MKRKLISATQKEEEKNKFNGGKKVCWNVYVFRSFKFIRKVYKTCAEIFNGPPGGGKSE
jgi:hypothetical protein